MTKLVYQSPKQQSRAKQGSKKNQFEGNLAQGLNRRAFLKIGGAAGLSSTLFACSQQSTPNEETAKTVAIKTSEPATSSVFSSHQQQVLEAVQQHLLPDDGNGPDAKAINAFGYLEFAMTDAQNIADGDPESIKQGIGWLEDLSNQSQGEAFLKLPFDKQATLLERIARSSAGENWLSLLMYYLTEAITLDPVYGGNTEQIGWQWLEHQAGFPRPIKGKTYRDFE